MKRACLGPRSGQGCPTGAVTDRPRCPACTRAKERTRGTRQERGYDAEHDVTRADYQSRMDDGETFRCWRCGEPIDPAHWTLGHCDIDRRNYHGPECPPCDYATSGRTGCPHRSHHPRGVGATPSGEPG